MSETEQDDAKRRQRARFVDVLTSTAQQPGERSRVGVRLAGATAVLALVAGGSLGLGAWRSYQAEQDAKGQKTAAEQAARGPLTENAAAARSDGAKSAADGAKPAVEGAEPAAGAGPGQPVQPARPAEAEVRAQGTAPEAARAQRQEQQQPAKPEAVKPEARPMVLSDRSGVLLKNAATGMCADLPFIGAGRYMMPVVQSKCGNSDDNQRWNIRVHRGATGPGGASLVLFVNAKDGLCMDLPERVPKPAGTLVQEANCHSTLEDNELWWLDPVGDGTVRIRNYMSNQLCLQLEDEFRVEIDRCDVDGDSRWRLTG
ncbi:RICIN domain-containing protein [Streptomyces erythrochromogenes]|uniref:RICIN domain-containing protein n=1 Tax=Streptomyces erythrochromogenes TaxID=285574 RepID=UPI0036B4F3FD